LTALHAPLCRALRLPADTPVSGLLALLVAAEPPPAPTEGHGDVILDLVAALPPEMAWLAAELLLRRALGFAKYGRPLRYADGRGIRDAREELLDAAVYLWREGETSAAVRCLGEAARL